MPVASVIMTQVWAVVTAALGAALLTSLGSLGVVRLQEWLRGKASDGDALHRAVLEVLSRSMAVAFRGQTIGQAMKVRSGLGEGLDIMLHIRKPLDHMQFHDWLAQDVVPLNTALAEIWTRWDQEGVRLANEVVDKCLNLMSAYTALQPVASGRERVRQWTVGERCTPEMLAENERALKDLALARKRLADYARAVLGLPTVDLFAHVESPEDQDGASPGANSGSESRGR